MRKDGGGTDAEEREKRTVSVRVGGDPFNCPRLLGRMARVGSDSCFAIQEELAKLWTKFPTFGVKEKKMCSHLFSVNGNLLSGEKKMV